MTEQSEDYRIGLKTQGKKRYRITIKDFIYRQLQQESIRQNKPIYELTDNALIQYLQNVNSQANTGSD